MALSRMSHPRRRSNRCLLVTVNPRAPVRSSAVLYSSRIFRTTACSENANRAGRRGPGSLRWLFRFGHRATGPRFSCVQCNRESSGIRYSRDRIRAERL